MEYEWGGQEKEGELMEVKIKRSEDAEDVIHLEDLKITCYVGEEVFQGVITHIQWDGLMWSERMEITIKGEPSKAFFGKVFKIIKSQ